jgi:hypothetical protein
MSGGATHKVVVFELNSGNHRHRRALANAWALAAIQRDGRIPIVCAANCLQPDGQNDNGWDQGLVFLNPSKVWLQPPGYVTRMFARYHQPLLVPVEVTGADDMLTVCATRSADGKALTLCLVNLDDKPRPTRIQIDGFIPSKPVAVIEELSGPLDAANTAENREQFRPQKSEWRHTQQTREGTRTFPPHSFVILRFE